MKVKLNDSEVLAVESTIRDYNVSVNKDRLFAWLLVKHGITENDIKDIIYGRENEYL